MEPRTTKGYPKEAKAWKEQAGESGEAPGRSMRILTQNLIPAKLPGKLREVKEFRGTRENPEESGEPGGAQGSPGEPREPKGAQGSPRELEEPKGSPGEPRGAQGSPREPKGCLLYTSPSPRDPKISRMPSSA